MKGVRRMVPVALALGGLLLATGCDVDEAGYTGSPTGHTVAIVGDDQTSSSQAALHTALDPYFSSRNISHDGATVATMQASATTLSGPAPDAVVVALGTNDVVKGVPTATSLSELDTMIAKFPTSCVVVVNLNEQTTTASYSNANADAFNQALSSRSVRVADWNGVLTGNLASYTKAPNQLVPTAAGEAALATVVTNNVFGCFSTGE